MAGARLQIVANTTAGDHITAIIHDSFSIEQREPVIDRSKLVIMPEGLSLVAASGELFQADTVVEISADEKGTSFSGLARSAKIKNGGRKLKTRGVINNVNVVDFFPDSDSRILRLTGSPCNITRIKIKRQGAQLMILNTSEAVQN